RWGRGRGRRGGRRPGGRSREPHLWVGGLEFSIRLDAVSVLMLGMISLLAAVIVRYSNSYLDGNDRHGVFLGWLTTTIAAVEVLVLAGNLGLLVVAWVATSASLHRLLVFYPDRRRAVVAVRCHRHPEVRAIPDARMAGRGHGYPDATVSVESPWEP
ncbi:MAG TPA: hypothetical protein VK988_16095, partial [Acidimicrobiales bacterium]|nr:hypothetical protein [Acidimicrobiales bacterium]